MPGRDARLLRKRLGRSGVLPRGSTPGRWRAGQARGGGPTAGAGLSVREPVDEPNPPHLGPQSAWHGLTDAWSRHRGKSERGAGPSPGATTPRPCTVLAGGTAGTPARLRRFPDRDARSHRTSLGGGVPRTPRERSAGTPRAPLRVREARRCAPRLPGLKLSRLPKHIQGGFLTRRLSGQARGGSSQVGCDRRSNAARRTPRRKTLELAEIALYPLGRRVSAPIAGRVSLELAVEGVAAEDP